MAISKTEDDKYITYTVWEKGETASTKPFIKDQVMIFLAAFGIAIIGMVILFLVGQKDILSDQMSIALLVGFGFIISLFYYNYKKKGYPIKFWIAKLKNKNIIFQDEGRIVKIPK